ncbi:MAG: GSCFA domain-containing protein [Bacteroidales bacterium]|nr:GSCFA domain-containing protein [Bacteroidales bacterium]
MMQRLRTEIERTPLRQLIGCREGVLLLGSCFTDNIGTWMQEHWLPVMSNPWGVLFNPASIAMSLKRVIASNDEDIPFELCFHEGRYFSFAHHSKWSGKDAEELQRQLVELDAQVRDFWQQTQHVIVTLGTSWVYEREGSVVANCHKFPTNDFVRRRLSVEEIVALWNPIIEASAYKHFIFTVSPIRHVKDGLHGNQLSKGTLLLAIDALQQHYAERVEYLPVYELLMDDLRDYRFYADDLVHPSPLAIEAVKELVTDCCFSIPLKKYMCEASPIVKAFRHRPSDPESEEYVKFRQDTLQRKDALLAKYGMAAPIFVP